MKFAIIGGDLRTIKLAVMLAKEQNQVYVYGLEKAEELKNIKNITQCESIKKTIQEVEIVIGPIPFSSNGKTINMPFSDKEISIREMMHVINAKVLIAGGIAPEVYEMANDEYIEIIDIMKREELAVLNTIATAEGTIQVAIENTNKIIHGSEILILGFGRIGKVLARKLAGLSAKVTCAARKDEDLAWIQAYGHKATNINSLGENLKLYDIIINTVPHIILNEERLKYIKKDSKVEVAFFGGSFTGIEEAKQEELLSAAYEYIKQKKVDSIRISTRPDYIDKKILKRLKKYKVKTIELGVQSANDYILKKAGRGHTFEDVVKASKLIRWYGFELGHQMMVGLPESTTVDEINTAKQLIKLKPKMVRIYPVLVIKNTKLEKDYNEGKYKPLTVTQAVEVCKELVKLFVKKHIEVIRIGLQPTDTITNPDNDKSEVVAGPFHPAFRQLVESGMWYDVIVEKIKQLNTKVKEVVVTVNPADVNNVIGQRKDNINNLRDVYDVNLIVKADEKIKQGKSKIEITKIYEDFSEK